MRTTLWTRVLVATLALGCAPDSERTSGPIPPDSSPAADAGAGQATAPAAEPSPGDPVEAFDATPEDSGASIKGIDVSHFQGDVDWSKVKAAGITFAFAKATEGITDLDPKFASNWSAMKEAGLIRGAYAFYVAGDDPTKQAAHFLATVDLQSGDLPPVVDIETKNGSTEANPAITADLHTYLTVLEKATGVKSIIYTSAKFWNSHFDDTFSAYPLWVAEYGVDEPKPVTGWDGWTFWQHSSGGTVDGVPKEVDLDSFAEGAASLKGLSLP